MSDDLVRHLLVVPIERLRANEMSSTDDLALYYELTPAIPTVRATVVGQEFRVGDHDAPIVNAANAAGRQEVRVWISADDFSVLNKDAEALVEVSPILLEAESIAPPIKKHHLLVLQDASIRRAHIRRAVAERIFIKILSFDVSRRGDTVIVLIVAETPVGDPAWVWRWLAALRVSAVSEGYQIRSYQGGPLPDIPLS